MHPPLCVCVCLCVHMLVFVSAPDFVVSHVCIRGGDYGLAGE